MFSERAVQFTAFIALGFTIRYLLLHSSYQKAIANRVEISTPVNSWKRSVEGVHLTKLGISPYEGDTFHEPPLLLIFYKTLMEVAGNWIPLIFVLCDIITALNLAFGSYLQLSSCVRDEDGYLKKLKEADKKQLEINRDNLSAIAFKVAAVYLLSPFSILACIAKSTSVFQNLVISSLLITTSIGFRCLSCLLLAVACYQSIYAVMLIVPTAMVLEARRQLQNEPNRSHVYCVKSIVWTVVLSVACFVGLLYASMLTVSNKWDFISSSFGFALSVPDFTPNIGLFWYFFTEMFDHFREFFLWTFQINSFLYVIPLALTLRKNPDFLFFVLLILLSLFKSYPSISDFGLYLALIPQWSHLFQYMKQGLIVACMFASCSVLAPIMWHLWIVMGNANSNYYFGVTLAHNTAQILLITDLLFAYTKRYFYLKNGIILDEDGKPVRLELVH